MQEEFYRIKRLPPYVFAEVNALKAKARAAGHDVIDLGMGNPDGPTPDHIVKKLVETVQNPAHPRLFHVARHRRPAPRPGRLLRAPIRRRARSRARGGRHSGLEGGARQPGAGDHRAGRHRAGAQPELPDPRLRLHHRRRLGAPRAGRARHRLHARARQGGDAFGAGAGGAAAQLPGQSDGAGGRSRFLRGGRGLLPHARHLSCCPTWPMPRFISTASRRPRCCRSRARATSPSSSRR